MTRSINLSDSKTIRVNDLTSAIVALFTFIGIISIGIYYLTISILSGIYYFAFLVPIVFGGLSLFPIGMLSEAVRVVTIEKPEEIEEIKEEESISAQEITTFEISQKQYNYLLPIYGICAAPRKASIRERDGLFFFFGTLSDFEEMKERCIYLD